MNPPPSNGGSQCLGISEETERCNFEQCPSKDIFSHCIVKPTIHSVTSLIGSL